MSHDLFSDMRAHVVQALRAALPDLPPEMLDRVEVTPTRDPAHGDMATNAALVAAKPAGRKPAEIAATAGRQPCKPFPRWRKPNRPARAS